MELNEIISRFPNSKKMADNRYESVCPAHNDKYPSLSLYVNGDWVNIKCFAGCSEDDILRTVGLKKADLYIGNKPYNPKVVNEEIYH